VRVRAAVVASVLVIAAPISAHTILAQQKPSTSMVTLRAFVLRPPGLLFSLHPTEARIVVSATANDALRVCEDGTTFSRHWTGGCRRLTRLAVALPTSGGAVHVGFRVMPSGATAARVTMLTVRWHCVDHDFILVRGSTRVRNVTPTFNC
jgi:hypothetical protein